MSPLTTNRLIGRLVQRKIDTTNGEDFSLIDLEGKYPISNTTRKNNVQTNMKIN